ncbi:MAG TPA: ribonuclease E/G [Stellaceae bacterium]
MRRELLISAGPGEWRAALLEDGAAVELYLERGDLPAPGSVFVGRVIRVLPGLDAALVDIGTERPGFLPSRRGEKPPEEGARVVVQLRREAQQDKGALLSARIIRPAGSLELGALLADADRLDPPAQLYPKPNLSGGMALRLLTRPDAIVTDDVGEIPELRTAFPDVAVARLDPEVWPVDLDALFEAALSPTLTLPGGGSIHIAETRAATLIDVDTGIPEAGSFERAALAVNLTATETIARQLRLRQIGGGVVVDFAGLEGRVARDEVRQALAAALAVDPAKPQILGWTRLGHLEVVRPRRGRPLSAAMLEPESTRKTVVAVAFEALRALQREARARPAANWRITASLAVAAALRGAAARGLKSLEERLGRRIAIATEPEDDIRDFDIAPV